MGDAKCVQAAKEKELGNDAYKRKDFATAIQHYNKAIELNPTEVTFLTNKAAVHFEEGKFDDCIAVCEKAVEIGRENRADFKIISKALGRIGNAYMKKNDLESAITYYNKSLAEHRAPDVVKRLQEVQKELKEKERLAYIDPTKAEESKSLGNDCFKSGKYPEAIKHYSEAIKRDPENAKLYSNRAAAYTKLCEFNIALKDCDECIRLDPQFIKGYLRKAALMLAVKDYPKARDVYQKALSIDENCQEALDGFRRASMMQSDDPNEVKKRVMSDPEIQQILSDPSMRMILEQMQKDPGAVQEHLQNPDVARKIQKLMECGMIQLR